MLFGTTSTSDETITTLSHRVTARYFKFVPRFIGNEWACMRLELYGCHGDKCKHQREKSFLIIRLLQIIFFDSLSAAVFLKIVSLFTKTYQNFKQRYLKK